MITPSFSDNITVYHAIKTVDEDSGRTLTTWERKVYNKCYFGTKEVEALTDNTLVKANSYTVRIPSVDDVIPITSGDIIVLGIVDDVISDKQGSRISDLVAKYKPNVCTVRTIRDNTKIPLGSHYAIGGV